MKATFIIALCFAVFSFAKANEGDEAQLLNFDNKLTQEYILKYFKQLRSYGDSGITAEVNEFVDKLFVNIEKYAVYHKLEPIPLSNISQKFIIEEIDLTNGNLRGITKLQRDGDVILNYQSKLRTVTLEVPIKFTNISFTYDYEAKVLGIGPKGYLVGEVDNFKLFLQLGFKFQTLTATVDKLKTTDSGHISVTIHGNITDIIFNLISEIVTTILHPLIQGIIEGIIKSVANNIVNEINEVLYNITHQNYTYINDIKFTLN